MLARHFLFIVFLMLQLASSFVAAQQRVPAGFEELAEEQVTEADIFYGGEYLGSSLVSFNSLHVQLLEAGKIAPLIPGQKLEAGLENLISAALPGNEHLVCHSDYQIDCGILETDSVAIIFNRSRLQIWLFVAPALLDAQGGDRGRFLPASSSDASLISNNSIYFSGLGLDQASFNLANNTVLSLGENRVTVRSLYTDNQGFNFDELSLVREFSGRQVGVGLLRPETGGFRFLDASRMLGVSVSSSLNTRTDLQDSLGSQVQVYLPTRSRIEIFRDGILLESSYYDAGNQILDTSALPHGAYSIDIRITDSAGNVSNEQHYYAKSSRLPPRDQSLYFMQAGSYYQRNLSFIGAIDNNEMDDSFLRAGLTRRVTDQSSASLAFSYQDNTAAVEGALYHRGINHEYQIGTALQQTGAAAFNLGYRYERENISFNLSAQKSIGRSESILPGAMGAQISSTLDLRHRFGVTSVFYREASTLNQYNQSNYGLRFRGNPIRTGGGRFSSSFELSRNNGELLGLLAFNYNLGRGNRDSIFNPRVALVNNPDSGIGDFGGSWQTRWAHRQSAQHNTYYSLRADADTRQSVMARMEAERSWGSTDLSARHVMDAGLTEFTGGLNTSFLTNFKSNKVGNGKNYSSGVIVEVKGDKSLDAQFNVMVDGVVKATLGGGKKTFIPLAAYKTYKIHVESIGNDLVVLSGETYTHTLYPGNVVDLAWTAKSITVLVGQIRDAEGNTIANALIANAEGFATTDENGYFQAEIDSESAVLNLRKGQETCTVKLPALTNQDKQVYFLGALSCL